MAGCCGTRETWNGWNAAACRPPTCSPRAGPRPRSPVSWGVSAQTASRWYARWRGGGVAGMSTARHGKPAQLGPAELAKLRRVLDRGAVQAGFDNDLWTLARVATVIEQVTGVAHHPGTCGASSRRCGGA